MSGAQAIIEADWPAPSGIRAFTSTRSGGISEGPWADWNLGARCDDQAAHVEENRNRLEDLLPGKVQWLRQVHGTGVHQKRSGINYEVEADAQWTSDPRQPCVILTADCLPVVFSCQSGHCVGVAHAGWRGLAAGILEATLDALPDSEYMAWLGPAIGPTAYEVGKDVLDQFPQSPEAFRRRGERWLMDLYGIARARLLRAGVKHVFGGNHCTWSEPERFYSYRRDGVTGRMATVVWKES